MWDHQQNSLWPTSTRHDTYSILKRTGWLALIDIACWRATPQAAVRKSKACQDVSASCWTREAKYAWPTVARLSLQWRPEDVEIERGSQQIGRESVSLRSMDWELGTSKEIQKNWERINPGPCDFHVHGIVELTNKKEYTGVYIYIYRGGQCPGDFYASGDVLYCKLWQPNVASIHKNIFKCFIKGIPKT